MGLWKEKYLATKSFPLGVLWKQKWTFWVLSCIFPPILRCRHIFVHLLVWGEWVTPYWLHCLPSPAAHQQQGQILPTGQQKEERKLEPLFVPLKSPTKTSQDKAEPGNTWQIPWGHCRVAAHVTKEAATWHRVAVTTRSSSPWESIYGMFVRELGLLSTSGHGLSERSSTSDMLTVSHTMHILLAERERWIPAVVN